MRDRIRAKLHSCSGESIAETLIATLIAALALLMLAGAISAAARVVTTSKTAMEAYYAADAEIVNGTAEDKASFNVEIGDTEYPCKYYENKSFISTPVILYTASEEAGT